MMTRKGMLGRSYRWRIGWGAGRGSRGRWQGRWEEREDLKGGGEEKRKLPFIK